jgi:4-hydroxybenzoate polyprenyltransferase
MTHNASELSGLAASKATASANRALAISLRPHQWVKNVLVFGGVIFSQSLIDPAAVIKSVHAFLTFCFAASAVYLLNDLHDLEEDRRHPTKRLRPLAAGELSPGTVVTTMLLLAMASIGNALLINVAFGVILSSYLVMNVAYSLRLKQVVILDVMIIAFGFLLRAVAGAVAIGVQPSPWLVLCTLTLALLVGFGKRRHELTLLKHEAASHRACLEGYSPEFLDAMMTICASAAVVTYALYTMAAETVARFGSHGLVLTTPFVIYGIFRYLFLIHKRSEGGDPAKLFVSDRPTLWNAALWCLTSCFVVYAPPGWLPW